MTGTPVGVRDCSIYRCTSVCVLSASGLCSLGVLVWACDSRAVRSSSASRLARASSSVYKARIWSVSCAIRASSASCSLCCCSAWRAMRAFSAIWAACCWFTLRAIRLSSAACSRRSVLLSGVLAAFWSRRPFCMLAARAASSVTC